MSLTCRAHPGSLVITPSTSAAVICDADDPYSVNTARPPISQRSSRYHRDAGQRISVRHLPSQLEPLVRVEHLLSDGTFSFRRRRNVDATEFQTILMLYQCTHPMLCSCAPTTSAKKTTHEAEVAPNATLATKGTWRISRWMSTL